MVWEIASWQIWIWGHWRWCCLCDSFGGFDTSKKWMLFMVACHWRVWMLKTWLWLIRTIPPGSHQDCVRYLILWCKVAEWESVSWDEKIMCTHTSKRRLTALESTWGHLREDNPVARAAYRHKAFLQQNNGTGQDWTSDEATTRGIVRWD
jgi:hypothetical protein